MRPTTFARGACPASSTTPCRPRWLGFASGQSSPKTIAARLDADDYFEQNGVVATPPTFLGNDDIGRAAQQIRARTGASISADERLKRDLLAHDLLFLLRGAPVVDAGDEVGMMGSGGDKAARQDMFTTQVAEWKTEPRVGSPPIGNGSSFAEPQHPISQRLAVLGHLRDTIPALSTGAYVRPLYPGQGARRQPHRRQRPARGARGLQLGHRPRDRLGDDVDAVGRLDGPARVGRGLLHQRAPCR